MANNKNSQKKQAAGRPEQKTRQSAARTENGPAQTSEKDKQKKKGPSRGVGALSVGLALFGVIWTFAAYRSNGPGWEALLGVVFVFFCLIHATFNFQWVKRQEAIERGELPDPRKTAAVKRHKYPVYRVKRKPKRVLKHGGTVSRL